MAGTNPRAARVAALIQRVIASSMEAQLHDKRLASVTITDVRVTNDLQIAKVYWTQLGHDGREQGERKRAKQALDQAKGRLRSLVGSKAGLRLTPQLQFIYDEVPSERMRSRISWLSRTSVTRRSPRRARPRSTRATPTRTSILKSAMTTSLTMTTSTTSTRTTSTMTTSKATASASRPWKMTPRTRRTRQRATAEPHISGSARRERIH